MEFKSHVFSNCFSIINLCMVHRHTVLKHVLYSTRMYSNLYILYLVLIPHKELTSIRTEETILIKLSIIVYIPYNSKRLNNPTINFLFKNKV